MDINLLVNISARAWAITILAAMGDGVPGRQATLLTATGAGRSAFATSMAHLIQLGLVRRRDGHGHPLRPEFELTQPGQAVAAFATTAIQQLGTTEDKALLRRTWTYPVIAVLSREDAYGEIRRALSPITDRALSQSLQTLEHAKWIAREVDAKARPPKPTYLTVGVGLSLAEVWLKYSEAA